MILLPYELFPDGLQERPTIHISTLQSMQLNVGRVMLYIILAITSPPASLRLLETLPLFSLIVTRVRIRILLKAIMVIGTLVDFMLGTTETSWSRPQLLRILP